MEIDDWAIIDQAGGWLVTVVRWTGDTSVWNPPAGTYAVLRSEINLSDLPENPENMENL